jgi:hypothetical protein
MSNIIVKESHEATGKNGKPYLIVMTVNDTKFKVWSDNQFIWSKFTPEASLDITFTEDKYGKVITGIVGVNPPNASGGTTLYKSPATGITEPANGTGNAIEMIYKLAKSTEEDVKEIKKLLTDFMADRELAQVLEVEAGKDEDELPKL